MKIYSYPLISKLFYRYGNIPVTLFLLVYLAVSVVEIFEHWYFIFFTILNLLLIISLNKYYIKTYKLFPFKITSNDEKIICTEYFLSRKTIEIKIEDIDKITGGIFSGFPTRPVYLYDSSQNLTIGFYSHAGKFN
ncbi:MAG: hypothetical protein AB1298_01840, partial [Bacteroidota bacterium]